MYYEYKKCKILLYMLDNGGSDGKLEAYTSHLSMPRGTYGISCMVGRKREREKKKVFKITIKTVIREREKCPFT